MKNLDSILKSRDITFANKGPHNQNYDFSPVVMYGCESCSIKKAEFQRTDAFKLGCWRRLEKIKPVNPKGISPEYSLEGLMRNLKLQYFGNLMQRADSLEKPLMLEKIEGKRRRVVESEMFRKHHGLNGHELDEFQGILEDRASVHGVHKESDMT